MPPSKLMQKLRKEHAKQVKKFKPTPRNNMIMRTISPLPTTAKKNLDAAVAKMKASQKKFNDNKKARSIKVINAKK